MNSLVSVFLSLLVLLSVLLSSTIVEAASLSCTKDADKDDDKALCSTTTIATTLEKCQQDTHHCIFITHEDGTRTGAGCIKLEDNDDNPVTCGILQKVDDSISTCEYCTTNNCGPCTDGIQDVGGGIQYASAATTATSIINTSAVGFAMATIVTLFMVL